MKSSITDEEQYLAFIAIGDLFREVNSLSKKELFVCDQICNLYAADQMMSEELYADFILVLKNQESSSFSKMEM